MRAYRLFYQNTFYDHSLLMKAILVGQIDQRYIKPQKSKPNLHIVSIRFETFSWYSRLAWIAGLMHSP